VQCARAALDPSLDADHELPLLLELAGASESRYQTTIAYVQALGAIRLRLPLVADRPALAETLRKHADRMRAQVDQWVDRSFAELAQRLRLPNAGLDEMGSMLPSPLEQPLQRMVLAHRGAGPLLRSELERALAVHAEIDPRACRTLLRESRLVKDSAAYRLELALNGSDPNSTLIPEDAIWENRLLARGIAWLLDGQHRPIDDLDPAKGRLRTIVQDGHITALYSVGWDGHDDGGLVGADLVWWVDPASAPRH
jgi:hypothetical protein